MRLWMRLVGVYYLLQFVAMVVVRAPIRAQGPDGALALASAGDPLARFLVETWTTFGLEVGAIGVVVLLASRAPARAVGLIWMVIAIELSRGIVADLWMLTRGGKLPVLVPWLLIHSLVILTGLWVLRRG